MILGFWGWFLSLPSSSSYISPIFMASIFSCSWRYFIYSEEILAASLNSYSSFNLKSLLQHFDFVILLELLKIKRPFRPLVFYVFIFEGDFDFLLASVEITSFLENVRELLTVSSLILLVLLGCLEITSIATELSLLKFTLMISFYKVVG